ncbi:MAG: NAD(P)-dependent oxidoreductase [Christensenellales bacterium]
MDQIYFVIRGDDKRNIHLAKMLRDDGYEVALWENPSCENEIPPVNMARIGAAPCILALPFSSSQEDIVYAIETINSGSVCFGGFANDETLKCAKIKNIAYHNILEHEPFTILNAIPTAEGALMCAMQNTLYTLHGSKVVVLGYGRVGKAAAKIFHACSCETTVVARSEEQLVYARSSGFRHAQLLELAPVLKDADIILNTIPAPILNRQMLSAIRPNALIIELASGKYNIDYSAANELGINVIVASSLPGKVAPISAARYMKEAILYYLK